MSRPDPISSLHLVAPILSHISEELDGDLSLRSLAALAGRSPFELHRTFKQLTGETPKRYVLRVRLQIAATALLTTPQSILDIALAHGFASHEVFTRAFRRQFDMSPSEFREQLSDASGRPLQPELARRLAPCLGLYGLQLKSSSTPQRNVTMPDVSVIDLNPQPALVIERRTTHGEVASTLGELLPKVFTYAQGKGIELAGPPFVRYLEFTRGSMVLQAGIPTAGAAKADDDIVAIELPGGQAATATHVGPYDTLESTYSLLEAWLRDNKREAGPPWESYLTDPATTPDPAEWQTLVVMPLKA